MTLRVLLYTCAKAGVGLAINGNRVRTRWTSGQPIPEIRREVVAHREAILGVLGEAPDGPDDPRWVVALLADIEAWRSWCRWCLERHGWAGPPDNAAGYAVYLDLVGGVLR